MGVTWQLWGARGAELGTRENASTDAKLLEIVTLGCNGESIALR